MCTSTNYDTRGQISVLNLVSYDIICLDKNWIKLIAQIQSSYTFNPRSKIFGSLCYPTILECTIKIIDLNEYS